ncbi:MAG TPA: response regulator [Thermoanaerobaculia bacterium]|nr:response regulator [Thermoanaerobaculia bacterium]
MQAAQATVAAPVVYVLDDDVSVRSSVERLVRSVGLEVHSFPSAMDFLDYGMPDRPSCLVVDVRMPGVSGLDLQDSLSTSGRGVPMIFITGHGTVPMGVRAMRAGAVNFIQKPFEDQELLDSIHQAIEREVLSCSERERQGKIELLFNSLTPREREVFHLVIAGLPNKQIAGRLGATEKTIKVHRARVMQKMQADSLAALVRMAIEAGLRTVS